MTVRDHSTPTPGAGDGARHHSWFSNPLDWPHIDRMILLAALVSISPLTLGGGLVLVYKLVPGWIDWQVANWIFLLYGTYFLLLLVFIAVALRRRRKKSSWSLMETFLITSFVVTTLIGSWLSGTQFTAGLLLLLLGVNVASPFASIQKLKRAYAVMYIMIVVFAVMQYSGKFAYAPLFTRPPYNPDGSPVTFWFVFQAALAMILLSILYIALMATERWGNRESLYREMSTVDGLTRLTNRRSFIERSESEFRRAQRSPSAQISCIMVDIDHFKSINDNHGHPAGDAVLVRVSEILMENARQYDEVGRYGGEEFAILLPATPLESATKVAERLRESIAATEVAVDGESLRVTASFGVASYPSSDIQSVNGLLKAADTALYTAKNSGRNRVAMASESS